eukprot:tig00000443_g763.t1
MDGTAAADVADALHPHPWSGNDTAPTTLATHDGHSSDIQPRNVGQFGTEFIYSLPFGTDVADNTKMFGGLDMGAFKTIELTLTTLKTYGADKPVADIYCRYYNEITFTNGGAYRRFH